MIKVDFQRLSIDTRKDLELAKKMMLSRIKSEY